MLTHILTAFTAVTLVAECDPRFIDTLHDEAYKQVKLMLEQAEPGTAVVPLSEATYSNLVLPGNRHFRSTVLFFDSTKEEQLRLRDIYCTVASHFGKQEIASSTSVDKYIPIYFFTIDVTQPNIDWLYELHGIDNIPELLRFGLGKSVTANRKVNTDSFNKWLAIRTSDVIRWTPVEAYNELIEFCSRPWPDEIPTEYKSTLLTALESNKTSSYIIAIILILAIAVYAIVYRPPWLLMAGALAFYTLCSMCIISAWLGSKPRVKNIVQDRLYLHKLLQHNFTMSSNTQYMYEGTIVQLMIIVLSALIFTLNTPGMYTSKILWSICLGMLLILVIMLGVIFNHKRMAYSLAVMPSRDIPRGWIDKDRGYLF